jgi:uncharacterized protein (DUF1330 family)
MIMLNLLRFKPRGDAGIYGLYSNVAAGEIKKTGSHVAYFGPVMGDLDPDLGFDASWDAMALPVYRRRGAFLQMQKSETYQAAVPYRVAGTTARLLYALSDLDASTATATIAKLHESQAPLTVSAGEVVVLTLLPPTDEADIDAYLAAAAPLVRNAGGEILLALKAEVPIVSELYWAHATVTRIPTRDALTTLYGAKAWKKVAKTFPGIADQQLRVAAQMNA